MIILVVLSLLECVVLEHVFFTNSKGGLNISSSYTSIEINFSEFSVIQFDPHGHTFEISKDGHNETVNEQRLYIVNSDGYPYLEDRIDFLENDYIIADQVFKIRSLTDDFILYYHVFPLEVIDEEEDNTSIEGLFEDFEEPDDPAIVGLFEDFIAIFIKEHDLDTKNVQLYLESLRLFRDTKFRACLYNESFIGQGYCIDGEVDDTCYSATEGDNPEQCRTRNKLFEEIQQRVVFLYLSPEEGSDYHLVLEVSFQTWIQLAIWLPTGILICFLCVICACILTICIAFPFLMPGCCGCIYSWVTCKCHQNQTSKIWIAFIFTPLEYVLDKKEGNNNDDGELEIKYEDPNIRDMDEEMGIEEINFTGPEVRVTLEDRQIMEGNMLDGIVVEVNEEKVIEEESSSSSSTTSEEEEEEENEGEEVSGSSELEESEVVGEEKGEVEEESGEDGS